MQEFKILKSPFLPQKRLFGLSTFTIGIQKNNFTIGKIAKLNEKKCFARIKKMLFSKRKRKKKFDGQEWRSILPYKCIKCKISFLEENSLKEHIESFHNVVYEGQEDKKKNKKIHKCPDCDICYDRIGHLEKHIAAVHEKEKEIKVYLCSMCDSQFKSMAGVTFHMVTEHEGKKPRQCSECNFNR